MKTYTLEELVDTYIGKKGSPDRGIHDLKILKYVLGQKIKYERERLKLNQDQFGQHFDLQKSRISKIENGDCSLDTLILVLYRLKVDININMHNG